MAQIGAECRKRKKLKNQPNKKNPVPAARDFFCKRLFCKLNVYTYICVVKLEEAIKSTKFKNEVHKAGLNILYTAWWLKTVMSKELKEFGLTHEQYNVLRILKGKYPEQMCVRDIACRMIEKSSNVPRIIDRLELKKLVKRSTSAVDKRETVITLTQSGITILDATTARVNKIMDGTLLISEQDATSLNLLLEKVRMNEK
jgi:DNA-binding MarR family transcriptional regulator